MMGILRKTERFVVKAICGIQLKDSTISKDLMVMFGLNEMINQLTMASSVSWHGHVLKDNGHAM